MERHELAQFPLHWHHSLLGWVHFPPQLRCLDEDLNAPSWLLHRHMPLPLLDRPQLHVLTRIPAHLTEEVEPPPDTIGDSGRGSEPVGSALSVTASDPVPPGLRLLPVSRCLTFFFRL